jgi:hypothetical protein
MKKIALRNVLNLPDFTGCFFSVPAQTSLSQRLFGVIIASWRLGTVQQYCKLLLILIQNILVIKITPLELQR